MKYLLAVVIGFSILMAQIIDSDLDGVEDRYDKCPDTPFFALVDKDGCIVKELKPLSRDISYLVSIGYVYLKEESSYHSLFIDFLLNYKDFSFRIESSATSFNKGSSIDDLVLTLFYNKKYRLLTSTFGAGVYLPTNNLSSNRSDFFLSLRVDLETSKMDYFISLQNTFVRDRDSSDIFFYSIGAKYSFGSRLLCSISYQQSSSNRTSKYLTLGGSYYIKENLFFNSFYTKGLNVESKNFLLSIGYEF